MVKTKSVFYYNIKIEQDEIRFQAELPNHSDINLSKDNGKEHVYENVKEYILTDTPKSFGKPVMFTAYKDTNLMHDTTTRKSVISITHMNNKTSISIQPKVQAATLGSQFITETSNTNKMSKQYVPPGHLQKKHLLPGHLLPVCFQVIYRKSICCRVTCCRFASRSLTEKALATGSLAASSLYTILY